MEQKRIQLMASAPVKSAILRLALPTMLGMAVQMIYNLTDAFFIGRTGDMNLVAAIALASPIFMITQAIGNIFAIGTGTYVSRTLGEKNYEEARHASAFAVYSAVGIGLLVSLLFIIFRHPILSIIGTSPETYEPTSQYFSIISSFSFVMITVVTMMGMVRSEGATSKAMIGMILGVGVNMILDPIFILALNMGVRGAAWATAIGISVNVVYNINHLVGKKTLLSIAPKHFLASSKILRETMKIGLPSALSTAVMGISFVLVNVLAKQYGDHVVAGNGIQMRVNSMLIMLVIGLVQGFMPFAGYNFGAKQYDRLKQGFKTTLLYGTILSVFFTIVFIFFNEPLIRLFMEETDANAVATVAAGAKILRAFIWCAPFFGIQFTLVVTFQATGKALKAMVVSLGRQCLIYLPLLFILNSQFGFDGFIYAQPAADIITTIVAVLLSISFIKQMNTLHEDITLNGEKAA